MSALLIEWLNRDLHLDRRVTSVEKDLSNGYLLGQVLRELEVDLSFPAGYVDNDTVAAMVGNMEQLSIALRSHGIPFTVDIARGIMMEKKGAATKVLMDLHTHMEKRKTKAKHVVPSTLSVRPPANGNRHLPTTDPHDTTERFVETLIKSVDPADVNNHNRIDMAIHLRKFSEFMWQSDDATAAHLASKSQASAAASAERRHDEQTHTHEKQKFLQQWTDNGEKAWALNQAVQSTREATELQFELSLREKRRLVVVQQNDRAAADLHDGVAGFEKNFKRLGISTGDEDSNARLAPIQGTGLEHVATLETRVEACQFRPASNVQMMKELRERRKVHLSAHKERASRRRKMLVDQTRNTIEIHRKQEETQLLNRLLHVGKGRREVLAVLWQEQHDHTHAKAVRATQLATRVEEASMRMEAAVKNSLDVLHVVATATPRVREKEVQARAAKEATMAAALKRHEGHVHACREVVHTLIDMVWVMIVHRSAMSKAPMAPQTYRALKQAFVDGTVTPKPKKNAHTAKGHSGTEVAMLLSNYMQGTGAFDAPAFGPTDTPPSHDIDVVVTTLHDLSSKSRDDIVTAKWKPLSRPFLLCWYAKDPTCGVAKALADDTDLQLVTIDSCVDKAVKLGERVKGGEKLSPYESELAALGSKILALRAKNSVVSDAIVSDVVNKAVVWMFVHPPASFVGCILLNFPRSRDEAKVFEVEMVRRLTHLSDVECTARVSQLHPVLDDKTSLSEADLLARPPPVSSIDWVVFVDASDEAALATSLDESAKEALHTKIASWKALQAALTAFWKPFGCVYTIDPTTSTAFATAEVLHLLLELVAAPDAQLSLHASNARDKDAFSHTLEQAKQERRATFQLPELLYTQELAGERPPLPQELFATLYDTLAVQGVHAIQSKRKALFADLYDCFLQLSEHVCELRTSFCNALCGCGQQRHIDSTAQTLRALTSTNQRMQTKKLTSALEVTLGDMVDASCKAANEFLRARQPLLSPSTMMAHVNEWLEQLVACELSALESRAAALDVYFYQVENIALPERPDSTSVPSNVQPLMDALVRACSNSRFDSLLAPLAAFVPPRPAALPEDASTVTALTESEAVQPPLEADAARSLPSRVVATNCHSGDARRHRIVWNERALILRRVLAAIEFVAQLVRRVESIDVLERQSLNNVTVEYLRQEHACIQHVLKELMQPPPPQQPSRGPAATWPRSQNLTTPWIRHNVDIRGHESFLHLHHVVVLVKALSSSPHQDNGIVELSHFSKIVRETAIRHNERVRDEPLFPDSWTNFARISRGALPFCAGPNRVDWRRFCLSVFVAQWVPPPRTKQLRALLSQAKHDKPSSTIADMFWTKNVFTTLAMWFDPVVDQPAVVKDCLYDMFGQDGRVYMAQFLLHWCMSTYPTEIATALHASLAPFPRGLARAFRVLQAMPPSSPPSWDASKLGLLLKTSHVAADDIPSILDKFDYGAGDDDVASFVHQCQVHIPSLARHWDYHNVYNHFVE
ncbi:hypothetical protein H310_02910 [Aphanomyces invadans]|uniref:Calponin-homology (CH) domain-containing protein n=1 Tax=Aphanomyces invadans TaxID=157072 RepID=A0A024UM93_9STRA|nr:hypothetical protein H310_02910 [Aphanomyces invadans]ETW06748.1 hypothetical protein H310_02910 [Aphanomyces invadans]|eukprot:XP_008864823.1 hypothetical protein H310_02910 [Aphanomyces invadans]